MKKAVKLFTAAIAISTLTSCASILSKSEYPVSITSSPENVKFAIKDIETGKKIFEGSTPTTVVLKAGRGFFKSAKYQIVFYDKSGKPVENLNLQPTVDPWYVGNVLFGGIIGLLIVDPATGAMWKLPEEINADLPISDNKTSSIFIGNKELRIVSINDIPKNLKSKLQPINQ